MANIIRRFLQEAPQIGFFKKGIAIHPKKIQQIVPGLTTNLKKATQSYIEGLLQLDDSYLKNTSSPYLFSRLNNQIQQLKANPSPELQGLIKDFSSKLELGSKTEEQSNNYDKKFGMTIFPYVIFGVTLPQRIKQHPQQNIIHITRNRYINKNNIVGSLSDMILNRGNQIYGFRCQYIKIQNRQLLVSLTFEGDIDKEEYYVTDLNQNLINEQRK